MLRLKTKEYIVKSKIDRIKYATGRRRIEIDP